MINPAELVDKLVEKMRDIPDLVHEVIGDPERIYAYHDDFPRHVSLALAIYKMPCPSIMLAWQGTTPGATGPAEVWKHQITAYLRAGESEFLEQPAGFYRMFRLMTRGTVESTGLSLLNDEVHPNCYPMDTPTIARVTDPEGVDYFEVQMTFTEIGDE